MLSSDIDSSFFQSAAVWQRASMRESAILGVFAASGPVTQPFVG